MTTAALLLTILGALIVAIVAYAGFWLWIDAREAAAQRRREAAMADVLARTLREARIPAKDTQPNRYLRTNEGAPE